MVHRSTLYLICARITHDVCELRSELEEAELFGPQLKICPSPRPLSNRSRHHSSLSHRSLAVCVTQHNRCNRPQLHLQAAEGRFSGIRQSEEHCSTTYHPGSTRSARQTPSKMFRQQPQNLQTQDLLKSECM